VEERFQRKLISVPQTAFGARLVELLDAALELALDLRRDTDAKAPARIYGAGAWTTELRRILSSGFRMASLAATAAFIKGRE
jgi:hypothetical protein